MRPTLADQDGLIASQLAIVMPAVLLLIMLAVQLGLWSHATQLVRLAADEAAQLSALPDASDETARAAAIDLLAQTGTLTDVAVTLDRRPELVVVTVTGHPPQVVPGIRWPASATAAAPLERFIPQGSR